MNTVIRAYAATDAGTKPENQDCAGIVSMDGEWHIHGMSGENEAVIQHIREGCLAIVSDGVSQFASSSLASQAVVRSISSQFPSFQLGNTAYVSRAVLAADETVRSQAEKRLKNPYGFAATMSALYIDDTRIIAANVGDSPIFRLRGKELEQLSCEDTLGMRRLQEGYGRDSIDEADFHTLTQCMGQSRPITPHVVCEKHQKGDVYIVMTDWAQETSLLKNRLQQYMEFNTGENPAKMLIEFVTRNMKDTSYIDNCTIIVLYLDEEEE